MTLIGSKLTNKQTNEQAIFELLKYKKTSAVKTDESASFLSYNSQIKLMKSKQYSLYYYLKELGEHGVKQKLSNETNNT